MLLGSENVGRKQKHRLLFLFLFAILHSIVWLLILKQREVKITEGGERSAGFISIPQHQKRTYSG